MNFKQIIAHRHLIYDHFKTPLNFRKHITVVADNAYQIARSHNLNQDRHATDASGQIKTLNEQLIAAACYVHDLGNILKVTPENASKYKGLEEDWQERRDLALKYGNSPSQATIGMLEDINAHTQVKRLVQYMEPHNLESVDKYSNPSHTEHLEVLICLYADATASPFGPVSLQTRRDESISRLGHSEEQNKYFSHLENIERKIFTDSFKVPYEFLTF